MGKRLKIEFLWLFDGEFEHLNLLFVVCPGCIRFNWVSMCVICTKCFAIKRERQRQIRETMRVRHKDREREREREREIPKIVQFIAHKMKEWNTRNSSSFHLIIIFG